MSSAPQQIPGASRSVQPHHTPLEEQLGRSAMSETSEDTTHEDEQGVALDSWVNYSNQLHASPASPSTPDAPEVEPKKCWICQMDETEDEPGTVWKKACPCSLDAHDECLLEWIADEERPKTGEIASPHKILCPVCKAEIKIQRPQDPIVNFFDRTQAMARRLIIPTALSAVFGCGYAGLFVYGVNTIYVVFGHEDAAKILLNMGEDAGLAVPRPKSPLNALWNLMTGTDPFFPHLYGPLRHWKPWATIPLIGPAIVLSRTKLSDFVFPLMISIYFINPSHRDIYHWPPSPGLTFATLPYIRTAYNEFYRYSFAALERKWDLAVQRKPREGETAEEIRQQVEDDNDRAIFELEIVDEAEEVPPGPGADVNWQGRIPGAAGNQNAPVAGGQGDGAADEGDERPGNRQVWGLQRNWSIAQAAIKITGALAFPAISSMMGNLLEIFLPAKMVGQRALRFRYGPTGFLHSKWGRTVAGGCLFVLLKDAVTLYCKWKKAQIFDKKKIIDYVPPTNRRRN
ncbi:hypothetical protein HYFRA_00004479 [Hymenoscyphus fraxineus]|uniref:RING-CH-type domain-containing protein n=1 Tax=Hymenoscyphus fraxineus TaxID=746836 RepID=A0A9N9PUI5_9HELO|nr:hypothetical protein HYFRA_00004479 [Hymenoscyphus fraxineus]